MVAPRQITGTDIVAALTTPLSVAQGGLGNSTGDASGLSVTATGVTAGQTATLASIAAQQGVLLDTFKLVPDADDTASLNRAVAAGVPILLGPKTYIVNDFSTGAVASFILRGIPGKSVIQRTAARGGTFFNVAAAKVFIEGVTFDMNKASVAANQWGVFLSSGGQTVVVRRSVFKNNSGSLGTGFALIDTSGNGPTAGGSFSFTDNEVTGCTSLGAAYFGSVVNGDISGNNFHDNSNNGLYVGSYGTSTATNYAANINIHHNRFLNNAATGVQIGGIAPPYVYGYPSAAWVRVEDNMFQDNALYNLTLQGDHLSAARNRFQQVGVTSFGGIDANSRYTDIFDNEIAYSGVTYGIDAGGSLHTVVRNNRIMMTGGTTINCGGSQYIDVIENRVHVLGSATAIVALDVDGDGSGNPFPTFTTGLKIERNSIFVDGGNARGVTTLDNAGGRSGAIPTIIEGNRFTALNGAGSGADIAAYASAAATIIQNNKHNGVGYQFNAVDGNGDLFFDIVFDEIRTYAAGVPIRQIGSTFVQTYGSGSQILYVSPANGGSGYVQSTTTLALTGSGGGSGWAGKALVYNGAIIGVQTTARGSGYSGTLTVTATDTSGGTGATFTVGASAQLPQTKRLNFVSTAGGDLIRGGNNAYIGVVGGPVLVGPNLMVQLEALTLGTYWTVVSYIPASYASGSLPTPTTQLSGAQIIVTGASGGKWLARCNGSAWIYADGTTAT